MVCSDAILQAVDPAGIFGNVTSHRAHRLAGGIRGIVKACPADRLGNPVIDDAGLYHYPLVVQIDVEDVAHGGHNN